MTVIRTPDERFENLPDFSFRPHYMELPDEKFGSLRMHYLDEGPATGKVILLMHGQGCWTYMFRKMIPILIDGGYRVIAPDYIGFGRSDKLPSTEDYSFQRHIGWLTAFFRGIEFNGVTALPVRLGRLFSGSESRPNTRRFFDRIALSNTQLPTGDSPGREWFINWRTEQFALPEFPQGEMVNSGVKRPLSPETIAAFDAPYIDEGFKTGPRRFPMILPISPDDPAAPANQVCLAKTGILGQTRIDAFPALISPAVRWVLRKFLNHIPGIQGQKHALLNNAGFYIVEDKSAELAERLMEFAAS